MSLEKNIYFYLLNKISNMAEFETTEVDTDEVDTYEEVESYDETSSEDSPTYEDYIAMKERLAKAERSLVDYKKKAKTSN
jgi:hypothetical protein